MKLYGGIDLHSNNSVVALLDEDELLVYRKRLPNDAPDILEALAPYREAIVGLVVEWYWLVDALKEAGYWVHLANTAAIVQYSGLKYSDDDSDARWLAQLLRLGNSHTRRIPAPARNVMTWCIATTRRCSHRAPAGVDRAAATAGGIPSHGSVVRPSRNVLRATPSPTATCRSGCPAANAAAATSSGSARSRRERCFTPAHRATTRHRRVATTRHLG